MTREVTQAAHDYVVRGLRVIALTGKMPNVKVHPHGLLDAFTDIHGEREFGAAFNHPDTTGVGIVTGKPLYVVDIDGPEGAQLWLRIVGEDDYIPEGWVAQTGRGLHLYFLDPDDWPTTKLGDKLDFKANGGYVAAPPSLHPSGHRYQWLLAPTDSDGINEMPSGLRENLERRRYEREARLAAKPAQRAVRRSALENGKWYPVSTFDGIIERMRSESEGNRNHILYWAARTMIEEGADEEDLQELLDAALGNGLHSREARRTIRSAIDAND